MKFGFEVGSCGKRQFPQKTTSQGESADHHEASHCSKRNEEIKVIKKLSSTYPRGEKNLKPFHFKMPVHNQLIISFLI